MPMTVDDYAKLRNPYRLKQDCDNVLLELHRALVHSSNQERLVANLFMAMTDLVQPHVLIGMIQTAREVDEKQQREESENKLDAKSPRMKLEVAK